MTPHHKPRRSAAELARMKHAVEGGVRRDVIALRFSCSVVTVEKLAAEHGWQWPGARPLSKTQAALPKRPMPTKTGRNPMFVRPPPTPFTPREGGCPIRDLRKDDPIAFEFWKGIYETRDRAERERAQA